MGALQIEAFLTMLAATLVEMGQDVQSSLSHSGGKKLVQPLL